MKRSEKHQQKNSRFAPDSHNPSSEKLADGSAQSIMKEIHMLYTKGSMSISSIAEDVGVNVYPPRKKVNVMIIGNHSAGKSSFVNWYIEDKVQSTGVAIETQGFTFVTSGIKRTLAPIKGDSTVMLFPYLREVKKRFGKHLVENLSTCVSVSKAKDFELVDIIDTPGLVDGDITYPYDVNEAILYLADHMDLILVFMDPMGQALCSRTMSVVKSLNSEHYDKMKYYLTKADTVTSSQELMKLMVQITQNIKENINNQHGLEIPIIWLPDRRRSTSRGDSDGDEPGIDESLNQIHGVCEIVGKSIHQKVQDNLSQIEEDCSNLRETIKKKLIKDQELSSARRSRQIVGTSLSSVAWLIPVFLFVTVITKHRENLPHAVLQAEIVVALLDFLCEVFNPVTEVFLPQDWLGLIKIFAVSIATFLALTSIAKFVYVRSNKFEVYPQEVVRRWRSYEKILDDVMKKRDSELNRCIEVPSTTNKFIHKVRRRLYEARGQLLNKSKERAAIEEVYILELEGSVTYLSKIPISFLPTVA